MTALIVYVPLNGEPTPVTITLFPTKNPWSVEVVKVAVLSVNSLLVTLLLPDGAGA